MLECYKTQMEIFHPGEGQVRWEDQTPWVTREKAVKMYRDLGQDAKLKHLRVIKLCQMCIELKE